MAAETTTIRGNRLLNSLPPELLAYLARDLQPITLRQPDILMQRGSVIEQVYFPTGCLISQVVDLKSGSTVEGLTVGKDGFADTAALFGKSHATLKTMVQISGEALVMGIGDFQNHLNQPLFRAALGSYVEEAISLLAQSAACLAFHPVEQRLARWLLEVQDRIDLDEFGLTQEFLSQMMGVHRPTATINVRLLASANLIGTRRGLIRILDRPGLEDAACECYRATKGRPRPDASTDGAGPHP